MANRYNVTQRDSGSFVLESSQSPEDFIARNLNLGSGLAYVWQNDKLVYDHTDPAHVAKYGVSQNRIPNPNFVFE